MLVFADLATLWDAALSKLVPMEEAGVYLKSAFGGGAAGRMTLLCCLFLEPACCCICVCPPARLLSNLTGNLEVQQQVDSAWHTIEAAA